MTKLKLNLMIMLMLYLFAGSMRAEKNLTVYEGTDTQGMIPVAGGTFNYYNKSQYVIPAAQLTDMVGVQRGRVQRGRVSVSLRCKKSDV